MQLFRGAAGAIDATSSGNAFAVSFMIKTADFRHDLYVARVGNQNPLAPTEIRKLATLITPLNRQPDLTLVSTSDGSLATAYTRIAEEPEIGAVSRAFVQLPVVVVRTRAVRR